jgi:hypothetical protein
MAGFGCPFGAEPTAAQTAKHGTLSNSEGAGEGDLTLAAVVHEVNLDRRHGRDGEGKGNDDALHGEYDEKWFEEEVR